MYRLRILILSAALAAPLAYALSQVKPQSRPIRRVAVVGAGIAGLSLAHALKNSPQLRKDADTQDLHVSIFDSRESLDYSAGSGVQLNGGVAVLGKINPDLQQAVIDAAVPISTLKGRNKSWKDGSQEDTLWNLSVESLFRKAGGEAEQEIIVDGTVMWFAVMRGALQDVLMRTLPKDDGLEVSFGKALTGIEGRSGSAVCHFADGTESGPFDLIVGCDGIKSGVKEFIEKGKISEDASQREGTAAALYSGIRMGFAVNDGDESEMHKTPRDLKQTFADGAYIFKGTFGNGKDKPPCNCLFVTSLDENYNGPFKRKEAQSAVAASENSDWTQDVKKPKQESRQRMMEQLRDKNIPGDDVVAVIEDADRFFELGVYFHNPLSFSGWSKQVPETDECYTVLCGDSAHAMPPFLGQGANQAIQDAYLLAKKIYEFNAAIENPRESTETEEEQKAVTLKSMLRDYEGRRWAPTASITGKAAILGYLETGGRNGFYSKFRDLFFTILVFIGVPQKVLVDAATPKV